MSEKLRENIFPAAHAAISDWRAFPWHMHASSPKSSQALAIDVFGTIKVAETRDAVLAAVARALALPDDGPWALHLEWQDPSNALAEPRPTQVDALAEGAAAIILFECKFTEAGGGCSQINPDRKGAVACNGTYSLHTNIQNGKQARCALTGKGVKYWDYVADLYGLNPHDDMSPCPFAFDAYQWMRNVVLAESLRRATGKSVRVVAAYVDEDFLVTGLKAKTGLLGVKTLRSADAVTPLPYRRILEIAATTAPSPVWSDLSTWVEAKIAAQRPSAAGSQ
jgi:hypothetical protein